MFHDIFLFIFSTPKKKKKKSSYYIIFIQGFKLKSFILF